MDSPSARAAGEFHWGSTLWHEISHSFHAALSRHRVPRWFTEGLAVYEERRARPGWGDGPTPAFLTAFREGRLYPVSRLNSGFLRPAYPEQLGFSYYQASLVCELIANERGRGALTEMLRAFGRGASVEAAFRDVVGTGLDAFDGRFDAWVRARFADPLTALRGAPSDPSHAAAHDLDSLERRARDPDDLVSQLALGRALVERGEARRAVPYLERAKALFPQYAGPGNAYALLADAFQDLRDARRAIGELRALTSLNAGDYGALLALADLLTAAGDRHGAADALDRALYVYPLDPDVHLRLASLATALGDWRRAVRERRAVLALGPTDRADALYLLARAYFGARDLSQARTAVMQALEIAPSFQAAQELLLQIHEAGREP
jgi:tetratricopeptide (TPR) repeat protein